MLPTILTVNPMRKRHRRRRNPESRTRRVRAAKAGWRHRRRNPSRRHRRHVARGRNPHRRFHRRRHNPATSIKSTTREVTAMLVPAGIGAASAVVLDVAMAYLPLPAAVTSGWGGILAKAAGAVGLGVIAGMVAGKRNGMLVGAGALTVVGYDAIKTALAPTLGTSIKGLSGLADFADYSSVGVGAYMQPSGMGAYMNPAPMLPAPAGAMSPADSLRAKQVAGLSAYMARSRAAG